MNLVILQSKNQQVKNVCHMIIQDKITQNLWNNLEKRVK